MTTRSRLFVLLAAVVAMLAIDSVPAAAQEARGGSAPARGGAIPRRPDGKPDLTGRWNGSAGQIAHTNILEEHAGGFGINAGKSLIIGPNEHGFDYFFGFKSGAIDFYTHESADGSHDLFENATPVHPDGYMTDLITAHAVRFIEQHAAEPFFLDVSYNAAHWPFQVPDHYSKAARVAYQGPLDNPAPTRTSRSSEAI